MNIIKPSATVMEHNISKYEFIEKTPLFSGVVLHKRTKFP